MDCAVPICINSRKNSKSSGITFHPFPKDPDLRKAWIKAINVKNMVLDRKSKICSDHFPEESFYETKNGRKLYPTALPIIILDPDVSATLMICRICLAHHRNMHGIRAFSQAFEQITSISASEGDSRRLPQCICWECAARLTAAASFRAKALLSDGLLHDLLQPDTFIRIGDVKTINRNHFGLKTTLIQKHFDGDHFDCHIDDTYAEPFNNTNIINHIDLQNRTPEQQNESVEDSSLVKQNEVIKKQKRLNKSVKSNDVDRETNVDSEHDSTNNNTIESEEIKENIANNTVKKRKDLKNQTGKDANLNESDSEMTVAPANENGVEENTHIGNWNIGVEKSSKTITIVPLNVNKNKKKVRSTKKKGTRKSKRLTGKKSADKEPKQDMRFTGRKVDTEVFDVISLSHEEQVLEIEKRQESAFYKEAPHKCTVCYSAFKREDVFQRHMLKHSEKMGSMECFICKVRKKSKIRLNQHITLVHSKEYRCRKCPFITRFKTIAHSHEDIHAGRSSHRCEPCGIEFPRRSAYFAHRRFYHMSDIVCELCGFTFISQLGLYTHKTRQHLLDAELELKGPYCEKCDLKFLSEQAFEVHLRCSAKHLQGEDDPIRIRNEPGAKILPLSARRGPRVHKAVPNVKKPKETKESKEHQEPYICEQCGKKLRTHAMYTIHFTNDHPGLAPDQLPLEERSWMCDHCGKMFRTKQTLETHQSVHKGERLYQCDYCGKGFCQRHSLVGHIQVRHMECPPDNQCQLCDKTFTLPCNLKKHLFTHFGEKPYGCKVCDKHFNTNHGLQSHIRHVHDKVPRPKRRKIAPQEMDEE